MLRAASFIFGLVVAAGAGLALPATDAALAIGPGGGQPAVTCPDRLTGIAALECNCPSEATATGSVWGTDVYTDDSAICRAALHAGAIGTDGGMVFVHEAAGRGAYPASTRNSVASGEWGQWGRSIAFGRVGDAAYPAPDGGPDGCPSTAGGIAIGTALTCGCASAQTASGSVWGSDYYTADSSICRAAVHAGAIDSGGGGVVSLHVVAGRAAYRGSTRNGVATDNWGSYGSSFTFDD